MATVDRLHGILVFLRVVEMGSLSGAARALGVSTAAVSASLARLERKLEVRLLNRTTRRLSTTPEGAEYYARCKQIAADLEQAELTVGRAGRIPSGSLRVGVPSALGHTWIVPHLPEFVRAYPQVALEIVSRDFVPHTIESDLDIAVQVGELHSSSLAVRKLASTRYVTCASREYLQTHPAPVTPDDLVRHDCLTYRRPRNGRIREWRFSSGNAIRHLPVRGLATFNSGEALVAAAASGLGIIQCAEYYANPMLESGRLVEVLQDCKTTGYDIFAVFPPQQPLAPKLRVFVDFLVAIFNRPPWTKAKAAPRRRPARAD